MGAATFAEIRRRPAPFVNARVNAADIRSLPVCVLVNGSSQHVLDCHGHNALPFSPAPPATTLSVTPGLWGRSAAPVNLRELRLERGLSLEALGVLAGLDTSTISKVERGLVEPRPETIVRLGKALGIAARRMQAICANEEAEDACALG